MSIKDNDELTYILQYDEEMKHIILQVSSPSPISPAEYLLCLMDFIENSEKSVDELFNGEKDFILDKH